MSVDSRQARVFTVLLTSMTAGAVLLMALGKNPPSAGAFCLDSYYQLEPVEELLSSRIAQLSGRWSNIEVYYSCTRAGNIEQLTSLCGLASAQELNCHFVVCNGLGGKDGQIQSTEKWQRQQFIASAPKSDTGSKTIRVCVVADPGFAPPTDIQKKRVQALVEILSRRFNIRPESTHYPCDW
jgi:hypothetical protein